MPSTFSPNKGYELQATGEHINIWGIVLNQNFQAVDSNLAGAFPVSITSADVTLSAVQAASLSYNCTGVLTGNRALIFPQDGGFWLVRNATTGAFSLTVKMPTGATVVVPQGHITFIYSDAVDMRQVGSTSSTIITGAGAPSLAAPDSSVYYDTTAIQFYVRVASAWVAATPSYSTKTANTVLAGPATGVPATPAYRALVSDDIPLATTAAKGGVLLGSTSPTALGTATVGTSTAMAREDHIHPGANLASTTEVTGILAASHFPALTGDITTPSGSIATTLANTAVAPGAYGSATQVGTFTVDAKGRLTAAANAAIAIPGTAVSNTPAGGISATNVQGAINELDTEKANVLVYTRILASGSFTKATYPGAKAFRFKLRAGGGGGGSGAKVAVATATSGGGGGGGGASQDILVAEAALPASVTVTIGAGGAGGAAVTSAANGNAGAVGGTSGLNGTNFNVSAFGGGGGSGGAAATASAGGGGGGAGGPGGTAAGATPGAAGAGGGIAGVVNATSEGNPFPMGGGGGSGSRATGVTGDISKGAYQGSGGGAAGGGISVANVEGAGGATRNISNATVAAGGTVPGGNGATPVAMESVCGGAGGAASAATSGGAGGAGQLGGGGGGGGGTSQAGDGGAGGAGGAGYCDVYVYY